MTIDEAISSIQHTAARLRERNLRAMTRLESALLPKLSQKPARKQERRTVKCAATSGSLKSSCCRPSSHLLQTLVWLCGSGAAGTMPKSLEPSDTARQWRLCLLMDGQSLQLRLKAIKHEMATIQALEARYKRSTKHTPNERAAHETRRASLQSIKVELASLLPPKLH